jgi:hypothetical protein
MPVANRAGESYRGAERSEAFSSGLSPCCYWLVCRSSLGCAPFLRKGAFGRADDLSVNRRDGFGSEPLKGANVAKRDSKLGHYGLS